MSNTHGTERVEREFTGVYVQHWEIPRFYPSESSIPPRQSDERPERWHARFPEGFEFPEPDADLRHSPPRYYDLRVKGHLGPRGWYGHRGICVLELFISVVVSCVENKSPSEEFRSL